MLYNSNIKEHALTSKDEVLPAIVKK